MNGLIKLSVIVIEWQENTWKKILNRQRKTWRGVRRCETEIENPTSTL